MKMTCYLHCFGTVVLDGGVAKYLERWGLENMSKCCRVSWTVNSFFPSYTGLSVRHVCCVQGKWALISWRGKQPRHSLWPPRKIINVGSEKKESENCLTALFSQSQNVSYIKVYYIILQKTRTHGRSKIILDSELSFYFGVSFQLKPNVLAHI